MKGKREGSVDVFSPKHPTAISALKAHRSRLSARSLVQVGEWQVFWLVSQKSAFPCLHTVASCFLLPNLRSAKTYSSGDCPGFAPVFPFNAFSERKQPKTRRKVLR